MRRRPSPSRFGLRLLSGWLLAAGLGWVGLVAAPSATAQVVTGRVVSEEGRVPLPLATVSVQADGRAFHAVADERGWFLVPLPASERVFVGARHVGYEERTGGPFRLGAGDTLRVEIRLVAEAAALDEVVVEDRRDAYAELFRVTGFEDRRRRGWGQFLTREEIQARRPVAPTDLFASMRGVRVHADVLGGHLFSGNCRLSIYINGQRVVASEECPPSARRRCMHVMSLDGYVSVENIEGIEVYTRPVGMPIEYTGGREDCGAVFVWLRPTRPGR